jgi:hypothetical protein
MLERLSGCRRNTAFAHRGRDRDRDRDREERVRTSQDK